MPRVKDDTKAAVIREAALRLVIETGFSGLKMVDLATEANVATGTVYGYYENKQQLINDVYVHVKQEIIDLIINEDVMTEDYHQTLKNMWWAYFKFCVQNPQKMLFVEQFMFSGYIPKEVLQRMEDGLRPMMNFIELGQEIGILKKTTPLLIRAQIQGAIHEIIKFYFTQGLSISEEEQRACFRMAWDSIKA
jgi:AcrR family transcriptional regulator